MGRHSKYSPSGLYRTLNCAGCLNLCATLERKPSNKYAMTGSIAHDLGHKCLARNDDAEQYLGFYGWYDIGRTGVQALPLDKPGELQLVLTIDHEMCRAVQIYLDEMRRLHDKHPNATPLYEVKLDLSWLVPGMFGTGDHILPVALDTLYLDDYKNGYTLVEVEDNPQLKAYGLGALGPDNPDMIETVDMGIEQPNATHPQGPIRRYQMPVDELYAWGYDVLVPGVKAMKDPNAIRTPGEWCHFCDAITVCPERRKANLETAGVMFDDEIVPTGETFTLRGVKPLSGKQLSIILDFADVFAKWITEVRAEGFSRLEMNRDDSPSEYKLVDGKNSRKFKDESKVEKLLSKKLSPADMRSIPTFKSVAQMESAIKEKDLDPDIVLKGHIETKSGRKSMVKKIDARPQIQSKVEQMFGEE